MPYRRDSSPWLTRWLLSSSQNIGRVSWSENEARALGIDASNKQEMIDSVKYLLICETCLFRWSRGFATFCIS